MSCAAAVLAMLALDGAWTWAFAARWFGDLATSLGAEKRSGLETALIALVAYTLLAVGLCRFAVLPSTDAWSAAANGALLGLVLYGVFDFTNLAVFGASYPWTLALADVAWGTTLMAVAAVVGRLWAERGASP